MKQKRQLTKRFKKIIFIIFMIILVPSARAQYTSSAPINYTGKTSFTISGKDFTSGSGGAAVYLTSCSNVKIVNCRFRNIPTNVGIQLMKCSNIEIVDCVFDTIYTGVYAVSCTGGINIHCNSFKAIVGPKPRGQIVQFNTCTGPGNRINYNISDHKLSSTMTPEDLINIYASQGTASDPIQIIGNNLRGGGPSTTGGGIMIGDNFGKYIDIEDNIVVDPGQYGIGVPAGQNITVKNNKIYGKQQSFTNVGLYVGLASEIASGYPCDGSTITVEGNQVNWTNKTGGKSGWYNCSCCPVGTLSGNNFNATFGEEILPTTLTLSTTGCGTSTPPPNQPPVVSITTNGTTFTAPASVTITASASDPDGAVSKVDFYNGTTLLGTDVTAPYTFTFSESTAGTYSLTAKATDNSNAVTTSSAISVTVSAAPANKPPVVSLTSPTNGQSYTAPASIVIAASASDPDGTVLKVDFYNGTTLLGTDNTAPYTFTFSESTAGTYSLTAKATDNSNAVTTSSAVSVTVSSAPTNKPPVVSLTSPTNGQSYTAPASVTIAATASDADGTVKKVSFYNGTTLLNSDSTSPYSYSWTNVAAGTYSIKAIATDNLGATTSSSVASITVSSTTTIGIGGASCIEQNTSSSYTLTPPTGFTQASWWTNADATITVDPSDSKKVTVKYGASVSGAVILYCGANLNTSPYYTQYSKSVEVGNCVARLTALMPSSPSKELVIYPNPFTDETTVSLIEGTILQTRVVDITGKEYFNTGTIEGEKIVIGKELPSGVYILTIITESETYVKRLVKVE